MPNLDRLGYAERSFIALREAKKLATTVRGHQNVYTVRIIGHAAEAITYGLVAIAETLDEAVHLLRLIERHLAHMETLTDERQGDRPDLHHRDPD